MLRIETLSDGTYARNWRREELETRASRLYELSMFKVHLLINSFRQKGGKGFISMETKNA
ncbi:MAG TPA: hypothetical protein EYP59_19345 [Thiotrichaceae bacterium]|nr:hypothetical protein [Thiotrichaceae bacterium]